jgi:succinate dehydrogenase hydrophobic anchor subunit
MSKHFRSFILIFCTLLVFTPVFTHAQVIGETAISPLFKSIMDTIKFIAPLAGTAYIAYSAVQVFTDQDSSDKKGKLIRSIVITAVVLLFVFGAETIVNQLKGLTGSR